MTNISAQCNTLDEFCIASGDSVFIGFPTDTAVTWNWDFTGGLSDPSSSEAWASPITTISYTLNVTWPTIGTCTYEYVVNIEPFFTPGNDVVLCQGQTNQIGGPPLPGWSYSWTPATQLSNASIAQPDFISDGSVGEFEFIVTGTHPSFFCEIKDTIIVDVRDHSAQAGMDRDYCTGESVTLGAPPVAGMTYSWSGPGLSNPNVAQPIVTPIGNVQYTLNTSNSLTGCTDSDMIDLTELVTIVADAGPSSTTICVDDTISIGSTDLSGIGFTYSWAPDYRISNITAALPEVSPLVDTTYTLTLTDTNTGCVSTDSILVNVSDCACPMIDSVVASVNEICTEEVFDVEIYRSLNIAALGLHYNLASDGLLDAAQVYGGSAIAINESIPIEQSIVINELTYWGGDTIELWNTGNDVVDLSSWYLCSRFSYGQLSTLNVESGNLMLNPGEYVVITGFGFDDLNADVGLYNSSNFSNPDAMIDFVQYGTSGNGRESVAVAKGIWSAGSTVPRVAASGNSMSYDGSGNAISDWTEFTTSSYGLDNTNLTSSVFTSVSNISLPNNTGTSPVTYYLYATLGKDDPQRGSCPLLAIDSITVYPLPTANITGTQDICLGDTTNLTVTGGDNYIWSPNTNIDNINSSTPKVFPFVDTRYYVQVIDAVGCTTTDSIDITILPSPSLNTADATVCVGKSIILSSLVTDVNGTSGTNSFYTSLLDAQNETNPSSSLVIVNSTTEYYVRKNTTGSPSCFDIDSMTVNVKPSPDLVANDAGICPGSFVDLSARVTDNNNVPTITTFYPSVADASAETNALSSTFVNPSVTTIYYARKNAEAPAICFDIEPITVTVHSVPDLVPTNDTICFGTTILLDDFVVDANSTTGTTSYHTSLADAQNGVNAISATVSPLDTTLYYIRKATTTIPPCVDIDSVKIYVVSCGFDIALKKTLGPGQNSVVNPGDSAIFEITVFNQGPVTAYDIEIIDYIDADMVLADANWIPQGANAVRTIDNIASGDSAKITIRLQVDPTYLESTIGNQAEVVYATNIDGRGINIEDIDSSPDNIIDNDLNIDDVILDDGSSDEDDHDGAMISVSNGFDLALRKTLSSGQPSITYPGDIVTFDIEVSNQGPIDAYDIEITDYLPSGTTLADGAWTDNGSTASFIIDQLNANSDITISIDIEIGAAFTGNLIVNYAEISSASDEDGGALRQDQDGTFDSTNGNDIGGALNTVGEDDETNDRGIIDEDNHDPEDIIVCDIVLSDSSSNPSCPGENDGNIDITVIGGTPGLNYVWSDGNGFVEDIDDLVAGSYTISVTDANGCEASHTVILSDPADFLFNATTSDANCGATNGTITLSITGAIPVSYDWDDDTFDGLSALTGLTAGMYSVTVTDDQGCQQDTMIAIQSSSSLWLDAEENDISCFGADDGSINLVASGGTPPYAYDWDDDAFDGLDTLDNLTPGTYALTIEDANACQFVSTFNITEPDLLTVDTFTQQLACAGDGNGIIDLDVNGGTSPYSYTWNNGLANQQDQIGLSAGNYAYKVTDANGCEVIDSVIILDPPAFTVTAISNSSVCEGNTLTVTTSDAVTYSWTGPNGFSSSDRDLNFMNADPSLNGIYQVVAINTNACLDTFEISLDVAPATTAPSLSATASICNVDMGTGQNVIDLTNEILSGPTDGVWADIDASGGLVGSLFTATAAMSGNSYRFEYTVSGLGADGTPCGDQKDTITVSVNACGTFDLALQLDFVSGQVMSLGAGDPVGYHVMIENQGNLDAHDAIVVVDYPIDLIFDAANSPGWIDLGGSVAFSSPDMLAPGERDTFDVAFNLIAGSEDIEAIVVAEIQRAASIPSGPDETDDDSTFDNDVPGEDDQDELTIAINQTYDLALTMTAPVDSVDPGDTVIFDLEISNQSTLPANEVTLVVYLPSLFSFDPAANPGWTLGTNNRLYFTFNTAIGVGLSDMLNLQLEVLGNVIEGQEILIATEIVSGSFKIGGLQLSDSDGTFDDISSNDGVPIDDATTDPNDEDNHDIVLFYIRTSGCASINVNDIFSIAESCAENNGSILIDIANTGDFTFDFSPNLGVQGIGPHERVNLTRGLYDITITETANTTCTGLASIPVEFDCQPILDTVQVYIPTNAITELCMEPQNISLPKAASTSVICNDGSSIVPNAVIGRTTTDPTCIELESFNAFVGRFPDLLCAVFCTDDVIPVCDTTMIEVIVLPDTDIVKVDIPANETTSLCLGNDILQLVTPSTSSAVCDAGDPSSVAVADWDGECVSLSPAIGFSGISSDTICLISCFDSDDQLCDTTYICVNVVPGACPNYFDDELIVLQGDSISQLLDIVVNAPFEDFSSIYSLTINGETYDGTLVPTAFDTSRFYPINVVPGSGLEGPYDIDSWTVGATIFSGTVADVFDLVDSMNLWDPLGNWSYNANIGAISTEDLTASYGQLVITQQGSSSTNILNIDDSFDPQATIIQVPSGLSELIIPEICADTLTVAFTAPSNDIVYDTVFVGQVSQVCVDISELTTSPVSVDNYCIDQSGDNSTITVVGNDPCLDVDGLVIGNDTACIAICDEFGFCDTTTLHIYVRDTAVGAPITMDDTVQLFKNQFAVIPILMNDDTISALTEIEIIGQPINGDAFLNADNTIRFEPDLDYCSDVTTQVIQYMICNIDGCSRGLVNIDVLCDELKVNNGFSPNGDGVNDAFYIQAALLFPNNHLRVYNRYGAQVLRVDGYQNDWEGRWEGRDLPDGIYWYVFDTGEGRTLSGYVALYRH